jgi:predicted TIM-barrel fold metal-dependent hydrolase
LVIEMVRADAHLHFFEAGFDGRYGRSPSGGAEVEVYESLRSAHDIAAVLAVAYEGTPRYAGNSAYLAGLARTRPWLHATRFLPTRPAPLGLATLREDGYSGVSIYVLTEDDAEALLDWPAEAWAALDAAHAVVSLNCRPVAAARLEPVIERLPAAHVLFSHLGLPGRFATAPSPAEARDVLSPVLRLARFPQAAVKLSGFYAVSDPDHAYPHQAAEPFVAALVDAFGPRRLCWGSDYPVCLDRVSFVQTLRIPGLSEDLEGIAGDNLLRMLEGNGMGDGA